MDGLLDIHLADFKAWEASSSRRLLKADDSATTAKESIKAMHMRAHVGDLRFAGDGIANKGLLIRRLVVPGKEREGVETMKWLASQVSKDRFINVTEQYRPEAHVGKKRRKSSNCGDGEVRCGDLDRAVTGGERSLWSNKPQMSLDFGDSTNRPSTTGSPSS
ncbi:pyruvate formate lyase activating enzyme [Metarhizium album ARSEF 1941]|uniref:Pyruvate formate lyase activating enzyme n=1 Tax=Metarhizium album (strain ARSEF 1941) TaxID=1081103 RepID=A0A0B2X253_METAS|nr:pyruvate formate lyase activating enzyme [Metarhizium album ARSEF 1941]KHN99787.1 pyruvate formate lyase activating enzyme [Metarhizium album ARSEF 1941]